MAKISKISHQRPDGNKLLITTDHRRDPDLARTAPLTPIADGAPDADRHRAVPSDGRKIAASAPPAAPTTVLPYHTSNDPIRDLRRTASRSSPLDTVEALAPTTHCPPPPPPHPLTRTGEMCRPTERRSGKNLKNLPSAP